MVSNKGKKSEQLNTIRVQQLRGLARRPEKQRKVVVGLGLKRIGHTVELKDNACTRGAVAKIHHLVRIVP